MVELDLDEVEPSIAGPRRPQDRVPLAQAKAAFLESLGSFGIELPESEAGEETFPASDPTTEQAPGGHPVVALDESGVAVAVRDAAPERSRSHSTARTASSATARS